MSKRKKNRESEHIIPVLYFKKEKKRMLANFVVRSSHKAANSNTRFTARNDIIATLRAHACNSSCPCNVGRRMYSASATCLENDDLKKIDWKNRPGIWDEPELASMGLANKKWIEKTMKENPAYFDMNKAGHFPQMLWIGCVDARVAANELIGESAGSVFVHRNVANQIINTDVNVMSIIQFAVDYHKVKHIIVCGHYDCGGIKAAMEHKDHGSPLENWVRNIRDVYRLHKKELQAITDMGDLLTIPVEKARERRLTELNIIEQCRNLFKTANVQKARATSAKSEPFKQPQIHACVYEPSTGVLKKLPLDLDALELEMDQVYGLVDGK